MASKAPAKAAAKKASAARPTTRARSGKAKATWTIESVAAELLACEDERREREPFTDDWPELDLDTGYQIQDLNLAKRLERGEQLIGVKLGLTSRAKQQRMGVFSPFVAWLTDAMILPAGDPVPQGRLIHPRIEPEIVFVMGDGLAGPGVSCAQAMSAVESVYGGFEIIDSRYRNFRFKAGDVSADNASSGFFVTGPVGVHPSTIDLALEGVLVEVDGQIVDSATGAAVQGHPGEALALAANDLARRGHSIEPGWIVLTGGMTDAVFAPPGSSVAVHFTNLGSCFVNGGAEA
ncbi:MAG: 4-oxalocrotonate decarboxylase [Phycicoccus sp.]|uniref:2-keto-4-pentenoate hydratase n=1 Tax=Phycicoccus sp. TaxID=1902410 RepID=UPI00258D8373|nr:fumarylacetoacetate hydrolase family protein [Phycicoccus sp.]MCO5303780.1 4-oxalocrotonate decarboxylase [Phycicoccus sp.]